LDFLGDTGGRIMQTTDDLSIEESKRWHYLVCVANCVLSVLNKENDDDDDDDLGQRHLCPRNPEDERNTVVPTFF